MELSAHGHSGQWGPRPCPSISGVAKGGDGGGRQNWGNTNS